MTQQEAIKNIDDILDSPYLCDESIDYQLTTDDIECLEMAKKALEKQIPKKPILQGKYVFVCPFCKQDLGIEEEDISVYDMPTPKHCCHCGQALDWSDTE